jgi:hypothetical protein
LIFVEIFESFIYPICPELKKFLRGNTTMKKRLAVLFVAALLVFPAVSALGFAEVINTISGFLGAKGVTGFATAQQCVDTDNGTNVYVKGTCSDGTRAYTDKCYNSEKVYEYICSTYSDPPICATVGTKPCGSGYACVDGACVQAVEPKPDLAVSSLSVSPSSTVVGETVSVSALIKNVGGAVADNYSFEVDFGDGSGVGSVGPVSLVADSAKYESVSHSYSSPGTYTVRVAVSAPNEDNVADNVATRTVTISERTCNDTDGGRNAAVKGTCTDSRRTYTDYCYSSEKVYEYGCSADIDACASFGAMSCPAGTVCEDGACVLSNLTVCSEGACVEGAYVLSEGETKTYTLNSTAFKVALDYVGSADAKFNVNGKSTPALAEGVTYVMYTGLAISVVDITAQEFAGGVRKVEFSLDFHGSAGECHTNSLLTSLRQFSGSEHCGTGYNCVATYYSEVPTPEDAAFTLQNTKKAHCSSMFTGATSSYYIQSVCCEKEDCASHEISISNVLNRNGKMAVSYKGVGVADNVNAQLIVAFTSANTTTPIDGDGSGGANTTTPTSSSGGGGAGAINCSITGGVCGAASGSGVASCTVYTDCNYPSFKPDIRYYAKLTDKACSGVYDTFEIIKEAEVTEVVEETETVCELQKVESGSNKLEINEPLSNVLAYVTENDLPNTLKSGEITNEYGTFTYTQTLELPDNAKVLLAADPDDSNSQALPYLVFERAGNGYFYKLEFSSPLIVSKNGATLIGIENKRINLLGKDYMIVRATAASEVNAADWLLVEASIIDALNEGNTKTYTVAGKNYQVTLDYVGTDVKFTINGETTAALQKGEAYKLADATYIAVTDIVTQEFAGGARKVAFVMGPTTLQISDSNTAASHTGHITFNGEDLSNVYADIWATPPTKISEIDIWYSPSEQLYVGEGEGASAKADHTEKQEGTFLNSFDFLYSGLSTGLTENIELRPSDDYNYKLVFTNKAGILYSVPAFGLGADGKLFNGRFTGSRAYKLHLQYGWIKDEEYFVVSSPTNHYSRVLQLKGVNPGVSLADGNGTVKFKDLGTGSLIEVTYGKSCPTCPLKGSVVLDGNAYSIQISKDAGNASVFVDISGQGSFSGIVSIYTKYGGKITLNRGSLVIDTPTTDPYERIMVTIKNNNGIIDLKDNVALTGSYPTWTGGADIKPMMQYADGSYVYVWLTGYGAKVFMDRKGLDEQNEFTIVVPKEQVHANVYIASAGCSVPEIEPPECSPKECPDGSVVDCWPDSSGSCVCNACPEVERVRMEADIGKGWNLVGLMMFGSHNSEETTCSPNNFRAVYSYFPFERKYGSFKFYPERQRGLRNPNFMKGVTKEDQRLFEKYGDAAETGYLISTPINSVWAYSNKDCKVVADYPANSEVDNIVEIISYMQLKLVRGWNFFTVTPDMEGKTLNDIKGTCDIRAAYGFDNGWVNIKDRTFVSSDAGKGFLLGVSDNCVLGSLAPPPLPPTIASTVKGFVKEMAEEVKEEEAEEEVEE